MTLLLDGNDVAWLIDMCLLARGGRGRCRRFFFCVARLCAREARGATFEKLFLFCHVPTLTLTRFCLQIKEQLPQNSQDDDFVRFVGSPQREVFLEPYRIHRVAFDMCSNPSANALAWEAKLREFYQAQMSLYVESMPESPEIAFKIVRDNFAPFLEGWKLRQEMDNVLTEPAQNSPELGVMKEVAKDKEDEDEGFVQEKRVRDEASDLRDNQKESKRRKSAQRTKEAPSAGKKSRKAKANRKNKKRAVDSDQEEEDHIAEKQRAFNDMQKAAEAISEKSDDALQLAEIRRAAGMDPAALQLALSVAEKQLTKNNQLIQLLAQALASLCSVGDLSTSPTKNKKSPKKRKALQTYRPEMERLAVEQSPFLSEWKDDDGNAGLEVLISLVDRGVMIDPDQVASQLMRLRTNWSTCVQTWLGNNVGHDFPVYKERKDKKGEFVGLSVFCFCSPFCLLTEIFKCPLLSPRLYFNS